MPKSKEILQPTHTPGPWKQVEGNGSLFKYHVQTVGGFQIASLPGVEAYHKANARLISAAPDLLQAVKAMFDAADEMAAEFVSHKRAANWGIINAAYCDASAAIRKAEGK